MNKLTPTPDSVHCDFGYFHLTSKGWIRKDTQPFPSNRVETWQYAEERPADDAKDRIRLTRVWQKPGIAETELKSLRAHFGEVVSPDADRHITLDCTN